ATGAKSASEGNWSTGIIVLLRERSIAEAEDASEASPRQSLPRRFAMENDARSSGRMQAIAVGGLAVAVLDAVDAVVAPKPAFGISPLASYQFVASGLLGPAAYAGGVPAALLGLLVHFLVAFTAAAA